MKTIAIKGMIIPLLITCLCLIFLTPNNVMGQNIQRKNANATRVERAVKGNKDKMVSPLTEDQKAKIKDLRLEHSKAIQLLKAESEEMAAHLKTLNLSEKPDNKAIFKTIDEMMANRGEIIKRTISFKEAFKAILTPEQIKAMEARKLGNRMGMNGGNQGFGRQGGRNGGRGQMMQRGGRNNGGGQMMQRGGMGRQGQLMQRGQRPQGQAQMMNRQGQGFGVQMTPQFKQIQLRKRMQAVKEGEPKTTDTTTVK